MRRRAAGWRREAAPPRNRQAGKVRFAPPPLSPPPRYSNHAQWIQKVMFDRAREQGPHIRPAKAPCSACPAAPVARFKHAAPPRHSHYQHTHRLRRCRPHRPHNTRRGPAASPSLAGRGQGPRAGPPAPLAESVVARSSTTGCARAVGRPELPPPNCRRRRRPTAVVDAHLAPHSNQETAPLPQLEERGGRLPAKRTASTRRSMRVNGACKGGGDRGGAHCGGDRPPTLEVYVATQAGVFQRWN